MSIRYLGVLSKHDPLFAYLQNEIFPQVNWRRASGFRVFQLQGSNAVYRYEDTGSDARVIGKFFCPGNGADWDTAGRRMNREYRNLELVRSCGLLSHHHYIARPLGQNGIFGQLLVEEFCYGEPLDSVILRAIGNRDDGLLYRKLAALGYFLARMHNLNAGHERVDFAENCRYMNSLLSSLEFAGLTGGGELAYFHQLRDRWHDQPFMWEDNRVLVHGDATPANFLFGDGRHVISFDLERARRTDRVFDMGRLAGELKHFFLRSTGNGYAAEPFIGQLLWEYCCHFPDRHAAFASITRRIPYYQGITLLRIARNTYLPREYRRQLIEEAKECLRRGEL